MVAIGSSLLRSPSELCVPRLARLSIVFMYPDRLALLRFSHAVTITEPVWLRLKRSVCVDLDSVTLS